VTRLVLVTEIPAPFRIPLFNALAERVDLRVLFLQERQPNRLYDLHRGEMRFVWHVVPGVAATVGSHWLSLNSSIRRHLRDADAVLLGGWNQPAFWEALVRCRLSGTTTALWTESTAMDRRSGRLDRVKRLLVRAPTAFVVPGSAARAYLHELGIADERIVIAPNAVDPEVFGRGRRTRAAGPVRLVAVGRLAHEKGIDTLLAATRDLPVEVVVAGAGPEEARLRRIAGPNATFLGNVDRDGLADLYANADVAVMPSRSDPWGMVLNEAALAGLPIVSTTAAGAAWDLIEDGVNGFRVPPGDPDALRAAIERLAEDEAFRQAAGERSAEIGARFTPEAWADAVAVLAEKLAGR